MATLNACTTSTVDYTALLPAPKMDYFKEPFYTLELTKTEPVLHGL